MNASTTTKQTTLCSGDLIDVLIDPGDQTDDLICLMTRQEIKIEIRSPFWLRLKYLDVTQVLKKVVSMNYFFKLSSYLAKGHFLNRFGSHSGHQQIRSSNRSSSNQDANLVVVDAFSLTKPLCFYICAAISQNPSNQLFSGT